eukprot:667176-Hanusia_phi.AAC.1
MIPYRRLRRPDGLPGPARPGPGGDSESPGSDPRTQRVRTEPRPRRAQVRVTVPGHPVTTR